MKIFKRPETPQAPEAPRFAHCERVTATPTSPIHIREVGPEGLKFSGGIVGEALCGRDVARGWDLPGEVAEPFQTVRETGPDCAECVERWRAATRA